MGTNTIEHTISNATGKVSKAQCKAIFDWTDTLTVSLTINSKLGWTRQLTLTRTGKTLYFYKETMLIGFIDEFTGQIRFNLEYDCWTYNIFMCFLTTIMPVTWK